MPLLGALLAAITGSITSFLALIWAKKISVAALAVAGFAVALVALMASFNLLVSPLIASLFTTQWGQFLGLAFPPIAGSCLTSLSACWGACALYKLKMQAVRVTASA